MQCQQSLAASAVLARPAHTQAALVICRGTRAQLRCAADDVARQVRVVACTRQKRALLGVLEVAGHLKMVKDLPHALRCGVWVGVYHQGVFY